MPKKKVIEKQFSIGETLLGQIKGAVADGFEKIATSKSLAGEDVERWADLKKNLKAVHAALADLKEIKNG